MSRQPNQQQWGIKWVLVTPLLLYAVKFQHTVHWPSSSHHDDIYIPSNNNASMFSYISGVEHMLMHAYVLLFSGRARGRGGPLGNWLAPVWTECWSQGPLVWSIMTPYVLSIWIYHLEMVKLQPTCCILHQCKFMDIFQSSMWSTLQFPNSWGSKP